MKPSTYKGRRLIVRLKPGGFLRIPLHFLRHYGWQPGDVVICEAENGYLRLFKPPSKIAWRVERLRRRIAEMNTRGKHSGESVPCDALDSTADERRLERMIAPMVKPLAGQATGDPATTTSDISTSSSTITAAGGNVFLDMGFPAEEAERLKRDSDRRIARELRYSAQESCGNQLREAAMPIQLDSDLQAVVFDAYGTLAYITDRGDAYRKLLRYGQQQGRLLQPDDAATIMTCRGGLSEAAQRLGIHLPETVRQALERDLLVELDGITLFDDVNATLAELKRQKLKLGLCSNLAEPYAAPLLRQLSVPFDCYAWSFDVGAIKPSPIIYGYVMERLDCRPEQVLFVGDTPEADRDGPLRFGMQARLINRGEGERLQDSLRFD